MVNDFIPCATPGCRFHAVVPGGFCEVDEALAFPRTPADQDAWERQEFERIEREAREAFWDEEWSR